MEIHIGNRIAEVTLLKKEGNSVKLDIDGKEYDADIVMAENGVCSIIHKGDSYNAELIRDEDGRSYQINTMAASYNVQIQDSQAKYLRMRKGDDEKQDDQIV